MGAVPAGQPETGSVFRLTFASWRAALTWVWTMTRMTLQYFFMAAKSFCSCFLPWASRQRLQALVKAFFLLLCLLASGASARPYLLPPSLLPQVCCLLCKVEVPQGLRVK